MTVTGTGCQSGLLQILLLTLTLLLTLPVELLDALRVRLQMQQPRIGIEQNLRTIGQRQHLGCHPANRRQTQRPGQNRHMAGGATTNGGKARHLARIQRGGLGRGQLFGNQDRVVGQLQYAILHAKHQLEHALTNILQIQRPLGQ